MVALAGRSYDNSGRRATVDRQRRAVVEALAAELLDAGGGGELSLARAAERAGVSVRTAQRYFPRPQDRVDAVVEYIAAAMGPVDHPLEVVDDVPGFIRAAYARAARHWEWTTALARLGAGNDVRIRLLEPRRRRYAELLSGLGADDEQTRRVVAMVSLLASSEAGMPLVEIHGLTVAEAGEIAADTAAALIDRLRTGPP